MKIASMATNLTGENGMPVQVDLCYEDLTEFKCLAGYTTLQREEAT